VQPTLLEEEFAVKIETKSMKGRSMLSAAVLLFLGDVQSLLRRCHCLFELSGCLPMRLCAKLHLRRRG
jgi:hypothetical protein